MLQQICLHALGILETCIYLILLVGAIGTVTTYYAVTEYVLTITDEKPNLTTYLNLYKQYKSTLTCSCIQIAVPYKNFFTVNPSYHQYCSSYFNSKLWLGIIQSIELYLERIGNPTLVSPASASMALADLCRISVNTVTDSLIFFYDSTLISGYTIPSVIFESQVQSIIDLFTSTTANSFKRSATLIRRFLANDQVLRGAHETNFYGTVDTTFQLQQASVKFSFKTKFLNDTPCYCYIDSSCIELASIQAFGDNSRLITIPGIYVGCSIIQSVYKSTLQAFHDSTFISSIPVEPLNGIAKSRYNTTIPISIIVEQLFVEDWNTTYSYEKYYFGCQPSSCSYIIQTRRQPVEILTSVLGIIGGITTVLRVIIPLIIDTIDSYFNSEETEDISTTSVNDKRKRSDMYKETKHNINRDLTNINTEGGE
ncbi:hypothetical protein I4U23_022258 [Adineta vaga]|nr:hypothetical protein I4U23_022258 [Adineta vaga]